jgi:hypothetical protein
MRLFHNLKLRWWPPRLTDPDFGNLLFMYMPRGSSYWECEWTFPRTGTAISISLPGDESGPLPESRQFYLKLSGRFDEIIALVRPRLAEVLKSWQHQDLPDNIFTVLRLSGFGLEDPTIQSVEWDVMFETVGEKWLAITIPFKGETPGQAIVDT